MNLSQSQTSPTLSLHYYMINIIYAMKTLLQFFQVFIGAGTIFRLGEQKLNNFSVGEAKIGEKQLRQSNSLKYKFIQYVFLEKVYEMYFAPEAGEVSRIFVLLSTVSYRKNWGSRMY